ncbi:hypothetical protein ACHAXA_003447, partial [Cyclostephanos tholiformis]
CFSQAVPSPSPARLKFHLLLAPSKKMTTRGIKMLILALAMIVYVDGFGALLTPEIGRMGARSSTRLHGFPRAIHKEFTVEKATPEVMESLGVRRWPTWGTEGSDKYKTGIKSPLKYYDVNELSYIIKGKMEITPKETGIPVLVQAGDFVTFPDGFACHWFVIEPVTKHYYLYD